MNGRAGQTDRAESGPASLPPLNSTKAEVAIGLDDGSVILSQAPSHQPLEGDGSDIY